MLIFGTTMPPTPMDNLNFVSEKTIDGSVYILKRDSKDPRKTYVIKEDQIVPFDVKKWTDNVYIVGLF